MATLPGLQQGWRIVPGNDGWTFEAFELSPSCPAESPSADEPTRLPSMADLLLQGTIRCFSTFHVFSILEHWLPSFDYLLVMVLLDIETASPAMFCDASDGASVEDENYEGGGGQMFHTASGKPVAVKESSIKRAVAVLGEGGMPAAGTAWTFFLTSSSSLYLTPFLFLTFIGCDSYCILFIFPEIMVI